MNKEMHIAGDIRFAKSPTSAKHAQEVIRTLQTLMNQYGVVKIDVAINPWEKGPLKVKRTGPTINLN